MTLDYTPDLFSVAFGVVGYPDRDPDDPGDFIQHIEGKLLLLSEADEDQTPVGWTTGALFKLHEAVDVGVSVFDVLDYDSGETYACASLFRGNSLKPAVRNALGLSSPPDDLLLIERVVVHPQHRGHGIGLLSMRAWMNTFARSTTLVVCQPSPLTDEGQPLVDNDPGFDVRLERLRRYWSKAGFSQLAGSDLFVATTESAARRAI